MAAEVHERFKLEARNKNLKTYTRLPFVQPFNRSPAAATKPESNCCASVALKGAPCDATPTTYAWHPDYDLLLLTYCFLLAKNYYYEHR